MRLSIVLALSCLALSAGPLHAAEFQVENSYGAVSVRVSLEGQFQVQMHSSRRRARQQDVKVTQVEDGVRIVAEPFDSSPVDINLTIPFGSPIDIRTKDGKISLDGYPARFTAQTVSGEILLKAPWEATRLRFISRREPKDVSLPASPRFKARNDRELDEKRWVLEDRFKDEYVTYGAVRIRSQNTERLTIETMPLPAGAPVKMHWQALSVYNELTKAGPKTWRAPAQSNVQPPAEATAAVALEGQTVFSSDVRLVNLQVAVYDRQGAPIVGLGPQDFQVRENGVLQEISTVEAGDTPFNLALLFDLSSSTQRNRNQMKQIAARFLSVAQPYDKTAAYVLANNWFGVLSRLTSDRDSLAMRIGDLPDLSGGSPLYDAIVLAYDEELAKLPNERNALVVISDGIDNRLYGVGQPSAVSFTDIKRAAAKMNALLYPVFLGPSEENLSKGSRPYEAYMRFKETAAESGGRVFSAASLKEFDAVYDQIARELRAVYSVSYYPNNQDFAGEFRQVDVTVSREGATARTRPGYTAW
ncbi:MAG: VWA domain-containing protein [Acidobacteria bacterium]|nr:VWA domain-containing protein [Acidobacteriota bacterium]